MYIHSYNGLTWIARKSIDITISILMICVRTDDDLIKFSDLCFEMIELINFGVLLPCIFTWTVILLYFGFLDCAFEA